MNELSQVGQTMSCDVSRPTITNRLKGEKENLEARLAKINEALKLMEENPSVSKVLDILGQTYL